MGIPGGPAHPVYRSDGDQGCTVTPTATPTSNAAGRQLANDGQFQGRRPNRSSSGDDDGTAVTVVEPGEDGAGRMPGWARAGDIGGPATSVSPRRPVGCRSQAVDLHSPCDLRVTRVSTVETTSAD
jgi:hypothetical protein